MTRFFSISEIKYLVKESTRKRLPPCEQSDVNQQIVLDHELGFEAVLTDNGDEKSFYRKMGLLFTFLGDKTKNTYYVIHLYIVKLLVH